MNYIDGPARLASIEIDRIEPFHEVLAHFGVDPDEHSAWRIVTAAPVAGEPRQEQTVYLPVDSIQDGMLRISDNGTLRETYARSFKPLAATKIVQDVASELLGPDSQIPTLDVYDSFKSFVGGVALGSMASNLIDVPMVPDFAEAISFHIVAVSLFQSYYSKNAVSRCENEARVLATVKPQLFTELQNSVWPKFDFSQVATRQE